MSHGICDEQKNNSNVNNKPSSDMPSSEKFSISLSSDGVIEPTRSVNKKKKTEKVVYFYIGIYVTGG